ncbi:hypothetical protein BJY01DRAFT_246160 [Aspergillus pseudoustus]|uniref:Cytochrome P450 n=1 Tax=Aspergillus pseudoustus TaxID=1810923 RepID=A0ABR4K9G9_9EURO
MIPEVRLMLYIYQANVATGNLTVHLDKTAFADALLSNPNRWLAADGVSHHALVSFSVGPRKCIGTNLAELWLRVCLAASFKRSRAMLDESMTDEDMDMYDSFRASCFVGGPPALSRCQECLLPVSNG